VSIFLITECSLLNFFALSAKNQELAIFCSHVIKNFKDNHSDAIQRRRLQFTDSIFEVTAQFISNFLMML
jgi:hypothetical protein